MKKVILLILTLCSFFVYACDGGGSGGSTLVPIHIVTKPDPNNLDTVYGTYDLTHLEASIDGKFFKCSSPDLKARMVFEKYTDAHFLMDCFIPGIGVIYDYFEQNIYLTMAGATVVTVDEDNVTFATPMPIGGDRIIKGTKISDSMKVYRNPTPFTNTKTPLSADNYSTLTGTYIVEDAKARMQYTKQNQPVSLDCTITFKPQSTIRTASLESTTRSIFYGLYFECVNEQTGKKEENTLYGRGNRFNYRDGFVPSNWAGGGEPIILDNESVLLYISGSHFNGTISGEVKLRKIYDAIEIISQNDT